MLETTKYDPSPYLIMQKKCIIKCHEPLLLVSFRNAILISSPCLRNKEHVLPWRAAITENGQCAAITEKGQELP